MIISVLPANAQTRVKGIELLLCDIDGCLNSGAFAKLDLDALAECAHQVCALRALGVEVALCTGRGASYAQAFAQILGLTTQCVVENGALLLDTSTGRTTALVSPSARESLSRFGQCLLADQDWSAKLMLESGKEVCLSLTGPDIADQPAPSIAALMQTLMQRDGAAAFDWTHSTSAIDVVPKGVSKATGAWALMGYMGLDWSKTAAIGDSHGDLPVLRAAALTMCPQNAHPDLHDIVTVVAPAPFERGTAQLLSLFVKARKNDH